jgi:AraC family ethanolamine operon transcriptional activator
MVASLHNLPERLVTHDCEEFNTWSKLLGWDTDYRQLGAGDFEAWMEPSICAGMRIGNRYCNRSLSVIGSPPEDCLPVILPLKQGENGIFQGQCFGGDQAAIMSHHSEAAYRSPSEHHLLTVSISVQRFRRAFEAVTGQEAIASVTRTRVLDLVPHAQIQMHRCITAAIQLSRSTPLNVSVDKGLQEIEEHFLATLSLAMAGDTENRFGELGRCNRLNYLNRVRDYIESHLDAPLGLETLARVTGVSSRSICSAFRELLGISPQQYIKARRLAAARQVLLHNCDPDMTVTDVAHQFGLFHLGHFTADYKRQFGELPSKTLKR